MRRFGLPWGLTIAFVGCAHGVEIAPSGGSGGGGASASQSSTSASSSKTGTTSSSSGCTSACATCVGNDDCSSGEACIAGVCGPCSSASQCDSGQACVSGACGACTASSQCNAGTVCDFGQCLGGFEVPMYQCPGPVGLGGGAWGFYGCQNQITSTPTCNEIESPTTQDLTCTPVGKLAIITASVAPPPGTTFVEMYQCPGVVGLGGGAWGFYGCQNQIASTPTCNEIESPTTQTFDCMPIGKMSLSTMPPAPPPGGTNVAMYQCPGVVSLGGGSWGYYGCQSQITNTSTCNEIEYPTNQSFNCTPIGSMILLP